MSEVTVILFEDRYAQAFAELNLAWIEQYFDVEAQDRRELANPRRHFIERGGQVFFAVDPSGAVVGTCALAADSVGRFELCKMAVAPAARGQGVGARLLQAALDYARAEQAEAVWLLSNTQLKPALALYRKFGFQTVSHGTHPDYQRCNVHMELVL